MEGESSCENSTIQVKSAPFSAHFLVSAVCLDARRPYKESIQEGIWLLETSKQLRKTAYKISFRKRKERCQRVLDTNLNGSYS